MGGRRAQPQRLRHRQGLRHTASRNRRGKFSPRWRRSPGRRLAARALQQTHDGLGPMGPGGLRAPNGGRAPADDLRQQRQPMSDPTPLLVPMALQALLVNQDVQNGQEFHRWTPTYESLNEFADPIPAGFSESLTKPDQGVHLHWRLPSALTRAR